MTKKISQKPLLVRAALSFAIALVILSGLPVLAEQTSTTTQLNPGDEALKALRSEFDEASRGWSTKYQKASNDTERAELDKHRPLREFELKLLDLARTYAEEPVAMEAVQSLAETANPGPVFDEGLALIERYHIEDERIVKLCRTLVNRWTPGIEGFLLSVATKNSNRSVQGTAYLSLARELKGYREMSLHLQKADESSREQFRQKHGEEIAAWILAADPENLSARIDAICQRIIKEYSDVNDDEYLDSTGRRRSLADASKAFLFSLNPVGRMAPETDGEGVGGARISLSDQRGKVVVLMFSANWCGPCKAMYGHLRELMELYAERPFSVVTVMADSEISSVSQAVDAGEITWLAIWDGRDGPIASAWHATSFPTLYLIDRDGRIVGAGLSDDALDDAVARLLNVTENLRVKVDKRTRVSELSFKEKDVSGNDLPKLLEGYTELRELDLSHNPISDDDLVHLLPLQKLAILNLQHTHVTDKGLKTLASMKSLKKLHLSVHPSQGTTADGRRELKKAIPGLQVFFITH